MKWLYRWLDNRIQNSRYCEEDGPQDVPTTLSSLNSAKRRRVNSIRESDELSSEPIQFKMYKAAGGWAIEFRQYDTRNERMDTSLYVVNNEEELGNHLSKIITMEALKR